MNKFRFGLFMESQYPGRTFLGKRRCFSGIAALTPLTPSTCKQNAVNAFIPTKKTPLTLLTPLAFQLNAVNAVIPEKTCVYKKSDFLTPWRMRNSWSIIYLTKDYEAFRAYFLESVEELQETGVWAWTWRHWQCHWTCHGQTSVQKIHFTTRLVGVLQKFWQF